MESVQVTEPEWSPDQFDLVAALADEESESCPGCGHPLSETTDPTADPDSHDRTHRYVAGLPARCHSCTAISQMQEKYRDDPFPQALKLWPVKRYESPHKSQRLKKNRKRS